MIEFHHVEKQYQTKKGPLVQALSDINFILPNKGMVFVLGKSGSGKTTLLNLIGGLDKPDSGEILFHGRNLFSYTQRELNDYRNQSVGFVFQDYNLLDELSVEENIQLSLELQGRRCQEACDQALKSVGLDGYQKRRVSELSGGQKQRVAIARAIVKNPSLILADEPTGALDSKTGHEIMELLKSISKERLVVIVSHDEGLANEYGERIIHLSDGRVISDSGSSIKSENEERSKEAKGRKSLPFKRCLSLSRSFMKEKPYKVVLTLLLGVVGLSMVGLFGTGMSCKNDVEARIMSNSTGDCDTITVYPGKNRNNGSSTFVYGLNIPSYGLSMGSIKEKEELEKKTKMPFLGAINCCIPFYDSLVNQPDGVLYSGSISSLVEWNDNVTLKLISGDYPTGTNDVMITDYQLACFQENGFKYVDDADDEHSIAAGSVTPEALIGKPFGSDFLISGIVNTGYHDETYHFMKGLEEPEGLSEKQSILYRRLNLLRDYTMTNMLFLSPSAFYHFSMVTKPYVFQGRYDRFYRYDGNNGRMILFRDEEDMTITPEANMKYLFYQFAEDAPTILGEDEIPENPYQPKDKSDTKPFFDYLKSCALISTIQKDYEKFRQSKKYDHYFGELQKQNHVSDEGKEDTETKQQVLYTYLEHIIETAHTYPDDECFNDYISNSVTLYKKYLRLYPNKLIDETSVPSGYCLSFLTQPNPYKDSFYVPDAYYSDSLIKRKTGLIPEDNLYNCYVSFAPKTVQQAKTLIGFFNEIKYAKKKNIDNCYFFYQPSVLSSERFFEQYGQYYALMFFIFVPALILSVFFLINHILGTLQTKRREIAVLRALGTSSKDLWKIFSLESLGLAFMESVLSLGCVWGILAILNSKISSSYLTPSLAVYPLWSTYVEIIGIAFGIALLVTTLIILIYSKKNIASLLKERK